MRGGILIVVSTIQGVVGYFIPKIKEILLVSLMSLNMKSEKKALESSLRNLYSMEY